MGFMATIAQLQAYVDAAATAMAGSDYDTAIRNAAAGLAILGGIPTGQDAGAQVALDNARLALTDMITQARLLKAAALRATSGTGGIQRSNIRWKRPGI